MDLSNVMVGTTTFFKCVWLDLTKTMTKSSLKANHF